MTNPPWAQQSPDLFSSVIYLIWRMCFWVYWCSAQYIYTYDEIWLVSVWLPLWVVPVCWPELLSVGDGTIGSLFATTDPCSTSCHNEKCPLPADASLEFGRTVLPDLSSWAHETDDVEKTWCQVGRHRMGNGKWRKISWISTLHRVSIENTSWHTQNCTLAFIVNNVIR